MEISDARAAARVADRAAVCVADFKEVFNGGRTEAASAGVVLTNRDGILIFQDLGKRLITGALTVVANGVAQMGKIAGFPAEAENFNLEGENSRHHRKRITVYHFTQPTRHFNLWPSACTNRGEPTKHLPLHGSF
jgi:hypothetical protein